MAQWNYVIYAKTDFSSLDFDGSITTNASITPIYITIEDNDEWLGGTEDPSPSYDPVDTNGQQTIVASSDPSLLGQYIAFYHPVSSYDSSLFDTSSGWTTIVDMEVGGVDDFVMAFDSNKNAELSPNTTYNDTNPNNGKFATRYDQSALPCFVAGSSILIDQGDRDIENLRPGDAVVTADHGLQRIRWIGQRHISAAEIRATPKLRPIRIRKGALGSGLPAKDLMVSRQHRMTLRSRIIRRVCAVDEALVPAFRLLELPGVEIAWDARDITYFHVLFDRHEVIFANGCSTESLFPGPEAMACMTSEGRTEILSIFPEIAEQGMPWASARLFVDGHKARNLVSRHEKNGKRVFENDLRTGV